MSAAGWAVAAVAAVPLLAVPADAADVRIGVGITVGPSAPRYAQGYGYGYGRRAADTQRYGYERGRSEGAKDGFHDGERGRRYELYREDDYRDADKGYKGWMGPRWEYARGYQRGYEQGYRQGYDQGRRVCRRDHRHDDRCGHGRDAYGRERHEWDDDVIYEEPRRW
jgi:hypothetical protein